MPKKTKKEKILAEYRRKLDALSQTSIKHGTRVIDQTPPAQQSSYAFNVQSMSPKKEAGRTFTLPVDETQAIRKDLRTSLMLIGGMIAFELVIWRLVGR